MGNLSYDQGMPAAFYTIAQEPTTPLTPKQKAAVKGTIWVGGTILGVMFVIGIVLVILDRQRKHLLRSTEAKRKKTRLGKDAWAEAGRRVDPNAAGAKDDTVDIDPGDIGPHDVDGKDERDPHGQGPHG